MNKLVISLICFVVSGLILADLSRAADFTVDRRSLLHVGAAGAISASTNTMLAGSAVPEKDRNIVAFSIAFGAGLVKEFAMDSSHDYGDIFFNGVGAFGGIWISERYFISPSERGVVIGGKW